MRLVLEPIRRPQLQSLVNAAPFVSPADGAASSCADPHGLNSSRSSHQPRLSQIHTCQPNHLTLYLLGYIITYSRQEVCMISRFRLLHLTRVVLLVSLFSFTASLHSAVPHNGSILVSKAVPSDPQVI